MKRTDLQKKERELRKSQKKIDKIEKSQERVERTVGDYINDLFKLFFYDENKIYNLDNDEKLLELIEEMKEEIPDKQWENIIRKAVKKTQVKMKEEAVGKLMALL